MSTSLFSLIFAGVVGVGTFAGTLQQNLFHPKTPEIDLLFKEIEKLIRDFARDNPMTEKDAYEVKNGPSSSSVSDSVRRKRSADEKAESKNTLGVWTDIWVGLLSDYIKNLWIGDIKNVDASTTIDEKSRNFSDEEKQAAIKKADNGNKNEKERFKTKLDKAKNIIESIYEKMKKFLLKIEFPENYKYNTNSDIDGPYENYIEDILKN